jgi:hypothetical protein
MRRLCDGLSHSLMRPQEGECSPGVPRQPHPRESIRWLAVGIDMPADIPLPRRRRRAASGGIKRGGGAPEQYFHEAYQAGEDSPQRSTRHLILLHPRGGRQPGWPRRPRRKLPGFSTKSRRTGRKTHLRGESLPSVRQRHCMEVRLLVDYAELRRINGTEWQFSSESWDDRCRRR